METFVNITILEVEFITKKKKDVKNNTSYQSLCYANGTDLDYTLAFEDVPRKYEGTKKPDFHSHTCTTYSHRKCWHSLILAWIVLEERK